MSFKEFDHIQTIAIENYLDAEKENSHVHEILKGLLANNKYISSKFFYDKKGSELFEEITKLKEYYPTRTEKTILKNSIAPHIFTNLKNVKIIELGSGDCSKISILLSSLKKANIETVTYTPVDVSETALEKSVLTLVETFPGINIEGVVADFLNQFDYLKSEQKKIICFLGSTIGNLTKNEADGFIKNIASKMNIGDMLILGADMVKDIDIMEAAYNDSEHVTAQFNKNIVNAVNRILGTYFSPSHFEHKAFYNKHKQRIEMHLNCLNSYSCSVNGSQINILKGESIHTENSHKYTTDKLQSFAAKSGLNINEIYTDEKKYFSVCVFEKQDTFQ